MCELKGEVDEGQFGLPVRLHTSGR
jgi:hypothetical protein